MLQVIGSQPRQQRSTPSLMPVGEVAEQPVHAVDCGGVGSCRKSMYPACSITTTVPFTATSQLLPCTTTPIGGTALGDRPADAAGRPGYEKRSFRLGQSWPAPGSACRATISSQLSTSLPLSLTSPIIHTGTPARIGDNRAGNTEACCPSIHYISRTLARPRLFCRTARAQNCGDPPATRVRWHLRIETIERFLHSSYNQFAGRATVVTLLADRFARQRLNALARVEGKAHTGKPTVPFLCTHNSGRPQMALGCFTHLARDHAVAWSRGSEPGDEIHLAAIEAMREVGIDITGEFPKPGPKQSCKPPTPSSP